MNCSIYIFGELSDGYSQFPEDSSSNLFQNVYKICSAPTQMIIHRDGNLMYYIYVRKIDSRRYIGFAITVSGFYFASPLPLFSMFEIAIEELVEKGVVIHLTANGELMTGPGKLSDEEEEVSTILNALQAEIDRNKNIRQLPAVDYSFSINSQKIFNVSEKDSDIAEASYKFGYSIILKEEDYDTIRLSSFRSILKNLTEEKKKLIKANNDLRDTNKKILRKKKQFRNVVILFLAVIVCGICLLVVNDNLKTTQYLLDDANSTIQTNELIIAEKNLNITYLRDTVRVLRTDLHNEIIRRERAENELELVTSRVPFVITSSEVNSRSLKFSYFSTEEKEVTVTLKAIGESSTEIVSSNHTITLFRGEGMKELYFARALNTSQYYWIVLIYNGVVVAGRRW